MLKCLLAALVIVCLYAAIGAATISNALAPLMRAIR